MGRALLGMPPRSSELKPFYYHVLANKPVANKPVQAGILILESNGFSKYVVSFINSTTSNFNPFFCSEAGKLTKS